MNTKLRQSKTKTRNKEYGEKSAENEKRKEKEIKERIRKKTFLTDCIRHH